MKNGKWKMNDRHGTHKSDTVWTVNHLDLILVIYTNNRIWTDGVNEKGFGHNDTIIQCQT